MNLSRILAASVLVWMAFIAATPWAQRLESPYPGPSVPWLRGNLHTHTTNSDGKQDPQTVINEYAAMGYDFLMISDHDKITDPAPFDPKGMTLIPGNEISRKGPHLLHVGAAGLVEPDPDRQIVLDKIRGGAGGFAIMNHPNWTDNYNHCDYAVLEKLQGYAGIEIFNAVVLFLSGSECATDKWDRLLATGRTVWGFATDDSHDTGHRGIAWNMVQCASRKPEDIVAAMAAGQFYASTGVKVDEIKTEGLTVSVKAANAQSFRVCADAGRVLARFQGSDMQYSAIPDMKGVTYIRIECYGAGDAQAWLQPMRIKP